MTRPPSDRITPWFAHPRSWIYNQFTMAFWPKAKQLKYLISASFLSLVIGVLALFFELRSGITNLTADVAAESNVLDVRTSVPELAVLFRGQDIQQENLNLKILTVRLANDGEVNILENDFDSRIPWGLQIDRGRLVAVRATGSNSQYLLESLHPKLTDSSHVVFDKLIFDKGKYIALELLVLHNKSIEPQVHVVGKIAGMDEIQAPPRQLDENRRTAGLPGHAPPKRPSGKCRPALRSHRPRLLHGFYLQPARSWREIRRSSTRARMCSQIVRESQLCGG